jgi:hypothetical protein
VPIAAAAAAHPAAVVAAVLLLYLLTANTISTLNFAITAGTLLQQHTGQFI